MTHYKKPGFQWTGRADSQPNERVFQFIQKCDLTQAEIPHKEIVLLGFKSDVGVERNLGRPGAKEGPDAIRGALGGMAIHQPPQAIFDAGDYTVVGQDLEGAQAALAESVTKLHQAGNRLLLLGGGHEIAWPHYLGLRQAFPSKRIGIINIDAHFDLREPGDKGATSGTPFWQARAYAPDRFSYLVLGIQPQANTRSLYQTAKQWGVQYLEADQLRRDLQHGNLQIIQNFIDSVDCIYLTICLDALDVSIAPGVSAPSTNGLMLGIIRPLIRGLFSSGKIISADIAELSPPHDTNQSTTRLAAWLALEMLEKGFQL